MTPPFAIPNTYLFSMIRDTTHKTKFRSDIRSGKEATLRLGEFHELL